jgi:thiosulfate/3-mercaptopyruvate sulfurtransferase
LTKVASLVADDKPVISYCNTGHWASTNWFVLSEVLGKKNVRIYDGSMVEWSAKPALPIATGAVN